jgi:hypothetical protein
VPSHRAVQGDDACFPRRPDLVCLTVYQREAERQPRGPRLARQLSCPCFLAGGRVTGFGSAARIHGVTNIAAERRCLNGSDREILKRMGLSTGK